MPSAGSGLRLRTGWVGVRRPVLSGALRAVLVPARAEAPLVHPDEFRGALMSTMVRTPGRASTNGLRRLCLCPHPQKWCIRLNTRRPSLPATSCNNKLTTPRTRRSRRHHCCVPSEAARRSSWVEPRCRVVCSRCCAPRARRDQPPRQLERDPGFHSKRDAASSPRVRPCIVHSGRWPVRNAMPGCSPHQQRASCQRVQAGPIDDAA